MHQILSTQYNEVKGARQALFNYCGTFANADLLTNVQEFNNATILSLLTHVANTYVHWLAQFDKSSDVKFFDESKTKSLNDVFDIYSQVDKIVIEFLERYTTDYLQTINQQLPRREHILTVTPLQLFTHAITHEFHHKGQILTMSRLLGYIPQDTDVIRF